MNTSLYPNPNERVYGDYSWLTKVNVKRQAEAKRDYDIIQKNDEENAIIEGGESGNESSGYFGLD